METKTKHKHLKNIAQNLFKEKGFAATSMRDLANEANMGVASLYNHISSKEDILQEICFRIANEFFETLQEGDTHIKLSPDQKLDLAIKGHVKVIINNIDATAVFMNEWKHLTEPSLSEFIVLRNKYERSFVKIIKSGIKDGIFQKIKPKFAALTILSALNGIYDWYKPSGKMTQEEIGENLSKLLIKGLLK